MNEPIDPFRLLVPHAIFNIVLTEPRATDGGAVLQALNDQRVYMNLDGPPFPYTERDWQSWYSIINEASEECRSEWNDLVKDGGQAQASKIVGWQGREWVGRKMWVSTIRALEVSEADGAQERFIGEVDVRRSGFLHLPKQARHSAVDANTALLPGDPDIVWEIGCYLAPTHHNHGIMPAVIKTLMHEMLIPYMNVHTLVSTYFAQNQASRRVFEKCGFQLLNVLPDAAELPDSKLSAGGQQSGKMDIGVMIWERKTTTR
jgi:RimJ/RimL family protein N-acetyltransferase